MGYTKITDFFVIQKCLSLFLLYKNPLIFSVIRKIPLNFFDIQKITLHFFQYTKIPSLKIGLFHAAHPKEEGQAKGETSGKSQAVW